MSCQLPKMCVRASQSFGDRRRGMGVIRQETYVKYSETVFVTVCQTRNLFIYTGQERRQEVITKRTFETKVEILCV